MVAASFGRMFRTPRFAAGALLLVALAASTACAESKLSESESAPTTPPPLGTPAPGVTVDAAPTVTVADLPEVCGISDAWGLAVIRATDPAQAAGASPAELEAGLEQQAAAFEAA